MKRRLFALVVLTIALASVTPSTYAKESRPLAEALEELRAQGMRLLWGSNVVRADMMSEEPPESESLRERLDALLAPHKLTAREAEDGILVVVVIRSGSIVGTVVDAETNRPIGGAEVEIDGLPATRTGQDGAYRLDDVPEGKFVLAVRRAGYVIDSRPGRAIAAESVRVDVQLRPVEKTLEHMTVVPSRVSLLDDDPAPEVLWTRDEVNRLPHLSDDLFRAISRLSGVASSDFSADFHIRGGERSEVLVLIDGLRVYDPFHLKDFQNVFSIFDSNATGSVEMTSGGFTADYGDRMSGVIEISSVVPSDRRTMLGVSFEKLHFLSQGRFHGGESEWLVSARRGYLDLLLDTVSTEDNDIDVDPKYLDLFAKVRRRVGRSGLLSFNVLAAADDVTFRSDEDDDDLTSSWSDAYAWLTYDSSWGDWSQSTVLSYGNLERERDGQSGSNLSDPFFGGSQRDDRTVVRDVRDTRVAQLRHDWRWNGSDRHYLRAGVELRSLEAEYNYDFFNQVSDPLFTDEVLIETRNIDLDLSGETYGLFVSDRIRLGERFALELGARWDRQTYADDSQWSPRVNFVAELTPRTTIRASWGDYWQSQGIQELQVADGIDTFHTAQLNRQTTLALDHQIGSRYRLSAQAYAKRLRDPRPRFENLFDNFDIFPEGQSDRVRVAPERGRSRGLELLLERRSPRVDWWVSYALSEAEDQIDGIWQPRSWDQRHAVSYSLNLRPAQNWNLNFTGLHHSGWPATDVELVTEPGILPRLVPGPRNATTYSDYHRIDARISRTFPLRKGDLKLFFEVTNLLDRDNDRSVSDFEISLNDGRLQIEREFENWFPRLPSFGVSWTF